MNKSTSCYAMLYLYVEHANLTLGLQFIYLELATKQMHLADMRRAVNTWPTSLILY